MTVILLHCPEITVQRASMLIERNVTERLQANEMSMSDEPNPQNWDLRAIVEASDDAIIGTDLDGNVLSWNRGAERMYGYTEQEMIGEPIARIVPGDKFDAFQERLARLRAGEQLRNFETERIGKNGNRLLVSISVFPVLDADGRPVGIASITRNITALKTAEEKIRRNEELYRAIVEDQTEMICRSLPDSTLTFVNGSYARYFGKDPSELLGRRFLDFLPPEDASAMRTLLDSFTPERPVATSEHRVIMDGDDRERWQQWTDRAIYDRQGSLIEFQSVGRDITERKQAEQALQASEELNRAVLGSLRDQIAVLDRSGEIIAVNDGWIRFAAENEAQDFGLGSNYLDVCRQAVALHYPGADRSLRGIESVLNGSSESYREEYNCPTPSGDRWFLLSVTPLRRPEGGAVVSHIDITPRKIAEVELLANREELRKSRDETQQLAARLIRLQEEERARVAAELHDGIGQSLAIIRNRVNRCLGVADGPSAIVEQLEEISDAVAGAIDEVREVAYGLRPYELDRLGLRNAIESMIEKVGASASIDISSDLDEVSGILGPEAETNVYRIVQEAIHNVIDHSCATKLFVSIKKLESAVSVIIEDNGRGINKDSPRARKGFGLPGMSERARMMDAKLTFKSIASAGTRVELQVAF